jgi:hypothetical protein
MSIVHVQNKEAYFVAFKGIGICFTVGEDGKLVLESPDKDETVESAFNDFLANLRKFVKMRRGELRKIAAISPLLSLLKDADVNDNPMPPELHKTIQDGLNESQGVATTGITDAEDLIIDVTDLMMKYGIAVKNGDGEEASEKSDTAMEKLRNMLRRSS